jgi:hypothetical protein
LFLLPAARFSTASLRVDLDVIAGKLLDDGVAPFVKACETPAAEMATKMRWGLVGSSRPVPVSYHAWTQAS